MGKLSSPVRLAACDSSCRADQVSRKPGPRIALLTPYTGNNLGDAAIQDAIIANILARLPRAQFSGISLNCNNFVAQHGVGAFPLCGTNRPFYGMSGEGTEDQPGRREGLTGGSGQRGLVIDVTKNLLKRIPGLWWPLRTIRAWVKGGWREFRHCVGGYRFLRKQDILIVSGGGQLDEEWGGACGHPFSLFKWALIARAARVPYVIASVGAGKVESGLARYFLTKALSLSEYRSYRDKHSRRIAAELYPPAAEDSVVPDLAFSVPSAELPRAKGIRSIAEGRTVVAISPIVYAKPASWPFEDRTLYDRYLQQVARVMSQFLERGYFLVIVWSSRADENVIAELLERLDPESRKRRSRQMLLPTISTWKDLVAMFLDADFVITSRLHSAILSFVTERPTIAISFDPKVDWVMQDLGQADQTLQIRDFMAEDVFEALGRIQSRKDSVQLQIDEYLLEAASICAGQYDALAELAMMSHHRRN